MRSAENPLACRRSQASQSVCHAPIYVGMQLISHPALRQLWRGSSPPSARAHIFPLLPKVFLLALAVTPMVLVAWYASGLLRNIPMWDEFETVLQFLVRYRAADSLGEALKPFFAMANEHCMVTSRVIVVLLYEITGQANFIHLAIIGDLFIVGVVVLFTLQQKTLQARLVALAMISLLIFQLQHHENLFSSYASIDHFLVVLLTTVTLVLAQRGGLGALLLSGAAAVLAAFTLAHGLAVLVSVAILLAVQSRSRQLIGWLLFSGALCVLYGSRLAETPMKMAPQATPAGAGKIAGYMLSLIGGVPAIGHATLAPALGLVLMLALALAWSRRMWKREPFLMGMAVTAVLSAALIAYGRAGSMAVSPLSSRYMVQSAIAWSAVLMMFLKAIDSPVLFRRSAIAALSLAVVINSLGDSRFEVAAREFVQRRVDAMRYYDVARTMEGNNRRIFPEASRADAILTTAAKEGVFRLKPRGSAEVEMDVPLKEARLSYFLDRITVGPMSVHLKGWMFPEGQGSYDFDPYLMLRSEGRTYFFRGRKEYRPDLVAAMKRTDVEDSGFYFVIPKTDLPPQEFDVSLVLKRGDDALYSNTDHRVVLSEPAASETEESNEE